MGNSSRNLQKAVEAIVRDDSRYAAGAYIFVRMGLDFTIKRLAARDKNRKDRNVSAEELLDGIRAFALESFGQMAYTLLAEWGVSVWPRTILNSQICAWNSNNSHLTVR